MSRLSIFTAFALAGMCLHGLANPVPLELPDPDGIAGDATQPVKVYILAGQSNMVGFGTLSGARPQFSSIYLSADPDIIPGQVNVGRDRRGLSRFKILQSEDPKAPRGARVAVYRGAYAPGRDYSKQTPVKTDTLALGTTAAQLPGVEEPHTVVATAFITVPVSGTFLVHAGFGDSTHAIVSLDGKEVYRKDATGQPVLEEVKLEKARRYPVTITYLKGGSAAFWLEQVGLEGKGDLETAVKKEGLFPWMVTDEGAWTVRKDVTYAEARIAENGRWEDLTATSNGKFIGPEVPFGYVMGTFHDEQVLLIETSMGNRGLWWDFRPPSSGRKDPESEWEGKEYRLMVKGVHLILDKIAEVVPNYQGQGYDIAGFVWWQGHKDAYSSQPKEEYERNLIHLIQDLRKEFKAPNMPAVIATVGFGGWGIDARAGEIWKAQMAVADPQQHPELAGQVATVDTRGFWRDASESPTGAGYHYNHNAETYMLTGDALGRAMVELKRGTVEIPPPPEPEAGAVVEKSEPTDDDLAAAQAAMKPMIVDGLLADYLASPRNQTAIDKALKGERPKRENQFLRDALDSVVGYYDAVGIHAYDWHAFGPDLTTSPWQYATFDPPEKLDKAKGPRWRKVTLPAGMENWYAPAFNAKAGGWKTGKAPFGNFKGQKRPLGNCQDNFCNCGVAPGTLWDKEVLLMRKTVDVPPMKEGHRYRIVVGGSAHVNAGEGFVIYADGKKLAESNAGVGKRQGGQPRGAHLYADVLPEFQDGKVTLAVKSFLRYNHPRTDIYPRGHISVWLEEQKLPPLGQ